MNDVISPAEESVLVDETARSLSGAIEAYIADLGGRRSVRIVCQLEVQDGLLLAALAAAAEESTGLPRPLFHTGGTSYGIS